MADYPRSCISELVLAREQHRQTIESANIKIDRLTARIAKLEAHVVTKHKAMTSVMEQWQDESRLRREAEKQLAEYMGKVGELTGKLHRSEGQLAEARTAVKECSTFDELEARLFEVLGIDAAKNEAGASVGPTGLEQT